MQHAYAEEILFTYSGVEGSEVSHRFIAQSSADIPRGTSTGGMFAAGEHPLTGRGILPDH